MCTVVALALGCAPTLSPSSGASFADDEPLDDEQSYDTPFLAPPPVAPSAPGNVAWAGPERPSDDGLWAMTDPGELPTVHDGQGHALPLRHTHVAASLRNHLADVVVTQTFVNDASAPIEVVYAFPLPENGAVTRMRMVVGDRVIESDVAERTAARQTYEEAKRDGHTAALLEQERPNIFTQSLANVPAGEDLDIEIHYLQTMSWDAGEYEFVFPMVIGPRFVPPGDKVPDAAKINPPVVGEGTRRGDDFTIEVVAVAGAPIASWEAATHAVTTRTDHDQLHVQLRAAEQIPNRDFVLRYSLAATRPRATMQLGPADAQGRGHYALVVEPPKLDVDRLVGRREFVFVVDRSGSMSGPPLALAKQTVRAALLHLRPVDTFNVIGFESGTEVLWSAPRPANATHLAEALRFLDGMVAGGGTMMEGAVQAALQDAVAEGHNRYVMFLTDGFIGNEDEIFAGARDLVERIARGGQRARVFGVGIGSSPNRHLIAGLSKAGRGVPLEVGLSEHGERAVAAFTRYVDSAVVEDLRLEGGDLSLSAAHPAVLGDLFASHLAVSLGEYEGSTASPPRLHGTVDGKPVEIELTVVPSAESDTTMDARWARAAVADLEPRLWAGPDPEAQAQITALGLEHHLVTAFTSFIAVDRSRVVGDGTPALVVEPTIIPEGVDAQMAGAGMYQTQGISLAGTTSAGVDYSRAIVVSEFREGPAGVSLGGELHGQWPNNPRLLIGRATVQRGGRAPKVRKAVQSVRGQLRRCYAASPTFDRDDRHRLIVHLEFTADGPTITIGGSLDDPTDGCIADALAAVHWPPMAAGTRVRFELRLSAH
jgi:Ca-activated chloride channel family protein